MQGYIYHPRTLVPVATFAASAYKLPMEFVEGENGTITAASILPNCEQHFVKLEGFDNVWRVAAQGIRNDVTTLVIEDALACLQGISAHEEMAAGGEIGGELALRILGGHMNLPSDYGLVNYVYPNDNFLPRRFGVAEINGETHYSIFPNNNPGGLDDLAKNVFGSYSGEDIIKYEAVYSNRNFSDIDVAALVSAMRSDGLSFRAKIINTNDVVFRLPESLKINNGTIIKGADKFYVATGVGSIGTSVMERSPSDNWDWEAKGAPHNNFGTLEYFFSPTASLTVTHSIDQLVTRRIKTIDGLAIDSVINENVPYFAFVVDSYPTESKVVIMGDGHHYLSEYSANKGDFVSHIEIQKVNGMSLTASGFHYYLTESGAIVDSKSEQIPGQKITIFGQRVNSWNDGLPLAEEEFAKNEVEHKLVFKSDEIYHVGQRIRAVMETETIDTIISSVMVTSDDDRRVYTCGLMATTASEKIKSNSWRYGQRLPINPYVGQLVFT